MKFKNISICFILFYLLSTTPTLTTTEPTKLIIHDYLAVKLWAKYYSKEYKVPEKIGYSILRRETLWRDKDTTYVAEREGDFLKNKKTKKIEPKAFGPGQIHLKTAMGIWKDTLVTKEKLRDNIQFNIETTFKILRDNYDYFYNVKDRKLRWKYAINSYNTGIPNFEKNGRKINNYAIDVYSKSF